jgi:hypothetical protein
LCGRRAGWWGNFVLMITFRQHLDISKHSVSHSSLLEYVSTLTPEKKIKYIRDISENYPIKPTWNNSYKIHKNFNCYTDPMNLVLGQFIMLEQIITGKNKFKNESENDLAIAELILRPVEHDVFDNEDLENEKRNREAILNSPVVEVYSVINKFLSERDDLLFNKFSGVFYEIPSDDDTEQNEEEATNNNLFEQQWYWYSIVRSLAKEDITKYDDIYMLKMSTVMPEMSYLAQKNKIESARTRQQEAMRKL